MRSQVFKRGPTTPQMNITPLIDVVFLLIVFFMLVSNIVTNETVEMFVPEIDDSQAQQVPQDNRVIVNVVPQRFDRTQRAERPLRFDGTARLVQVGAHRQFSIDDLAGVTSALQQALDANAELEVVLRADSALYYDEVQPVMNAITAAGISRVSLVAYHPEQ